MCAVAGLTVAGANLAIYAVERDCLPDPYGYSDPCTAQEWISFGITVACWLVATYLVARREAIGPFACAFMGSTLWLGLVAFLLLLPRSGLSSEGALRGVVLRSCRCNHGARHRPPHGCRRFRDAGVHPLASPKAAAACCLSGNVSSRSRYSEIEKKWTHPLVQEDIGPRAGACRALRTCPLRRRAFHPASAPVIAVHLPQHPDEHRSAASDLPRSRSGARRRSGS